MDLSEQSGGRVPRLSHKKSRSGCQRCKQRRVKCDEQKPKCSSCRRHDVECLYGDSSSDRSNGTHANQIPLIPVQEESESRRLLELRLLHQFTTATALTLPGAHDDACNKNYIEVVPDLAHDFEALMSAILAISALHLSRQDPDDMELHRAQQAYFDSTLLQNSRAISKLEKHTADAAFFTSSLIAVESFAKLQERSLEPYRPPIQWLQISCGTAIVLRASSALRRNDVDTRVAVHINSSPIMYDHAELFHERHRRQFPLILFKPPDSTTAMTAADMELEHVYEDVASYIGSVQHAINRQEPIMAVCRRFVAFGPLVPPKFTEMVGMREPRALLILAYFFALAGHVRSVWWVGSTPQREVRGINSVLPNVWREAMRWPLEMAGVI